MCRFKRRLDRLENQLRVSTPSKFEMIIYDPAIPGDAERKAAEAHARGIEIIAFYPDNHRPDRE
jgi:hypothetical protein